MRLLMLGPPGAGKGTHGVHLSQEYKIAHISSGDLLRAEIKAGTPLGQKLGDYVARGELVPDEVLFDLMVPAVDQAAVETGGYIGDGFPRTLGQAERAHQLIGIDRDLPLQGVVYLDVAEEALIERILERARVQGRADDTAEVVRRRLEVFREHTMPLIDYYSGRQILIPINGDQPTESVYQDIISALTDRGVLMRPAPA